MENRIEILRETLDNLIGTLEAGGDYDTIVTAQTAFSDAVDEAKKKFDMGKIDVQAKGLPTEMHLFATKDLPKIIKDENEWPGLVKELRRFKRVMDLVVEPNEGD